MFLHICHLQDPLSNPSFYVNNIFIILLFIVNQMLNFNNSDLNLLTLDNNEQSKNLLPEYIYRPPKIDGSTLYYTENYTLGLDSFKAPTT